MQKNTRKIIIMAIGCTIGILLVIFGNLSNTKTQSPQEYILEDDEYYNYKSDTEKRLEEIITSINGITSADVFLELDSCAEYIYATDTSGNSIKHVINNGEPVFIKKVTPTVRGVAVVCTNGSTPLINAKVTQLLSSALNISTSKIFVTD